MTKHFESIVGTELTRVTGGTHTDTVPQTESERARQKRFIKRIQEQPFPSESIPGLD